MDGKEINVHLGGDGIPFLTRKSSVPNYKNGLPDRLRPQNVRRARVDVLDLSDFQQYEFYVKIWEAVGLGIATVVDEDKHWVDSKENWKVFIRWYVHGQMDPAELRSTRLETAQEMVNTNLENIGGPPCPGL